jgi:hypothetical protein
MGMPAAPGRTSHGEVAKALRWVVKHGMTRPVMDWLRDGRGHGAVRRAISADSPRPKKRGEDRDVA